MLSLLRTCQRFFGRIFISKIRQIILLLHSTDKHTCTEEEKSSQKNCLLVSLLVDLLSDESRKGMTFVKKRERERTKIAYVEALFVSGGSTVSDCSSC